MSMCRDLCCWKRVFAMTSVFSWQNTISLCPASFCTPRPNSFCNPSLCLDQLCWRSWSWTVLWRPTRPSRTNTPKRCPFHYRGLECKSRESRNTWLLLLLLLSRFSRVRLCAIPEMAAHSSLWFSRQEHWSGLPFPSPMHESEKWKWSRAVVSDT